LNEASGSCDACMYRSDGHQPTGIWLYPTTHGVIAERAATVSNHFPALRRGVRDEARFGKMLFMLPETRASIGIALTFAPNS